MRKSKRRPIDAVPGVCPSIGNKYIAFEMTMKYSECIEAGDSIHNTGEDLEGQWACDVPRMVH